MSIFYVPCLDNEIPIGTMVVIDNLTLKVRPYVQADDKEEDVIGVSYPKTGTNGRIAANSDGLPFMDFDYFTFGENFQLKDPLEENPNWNYVFNPSNAFNPYYCLVCSHGLAPVLNTISPPLSWKLIRYGIDYDTYLVK